MEQEKRESYEEEKRRIRRRAMIERAKQEKLRQQKIRRILLLAAPIVIVFILVLVVVLTAPKKNKDTNPKKEPIKEEQTLTESGPDETNPPEEGGQADETNPSVEGGQTEEENLSAEGGQAEAGSTSVEEGKGESGVFGEGLQELNDLISRGYIKLPPLQAKETDHMGGFPDSVVSENGILIDLETEEIVARKDPYLRISPASMTKILTVLVAAENVKSLDDTFTITIDITDYSFSNDCSNVGFSVGETVTVRDLFYGTILPSGADAALGLAIYTAGSHEAFVDLMNAKLEELGLSDTAHFTNCVGLYDKEHYCTVYDMAVMLKAAYDNPICRDVLSAHTYNTSLTEEHPEGILLSNWFLRRIEDKDTHGEVLAAKTGYVVQSKNCAASMAADVNGRKYICVTAGSTGSWRCIYDHVDIYAKYLRGE